ncbi:long-chain-fatty-acid--CoA ligase ACSBG2-like isoform X2 [Dysidea avara]|uniref:long-chain-fatty-acid--CoA ligase ACSBG2-like isoform X2 n=1 Tax=Dysidea avara TaxID=196820 RepID=UPI0033295BD7
MFEYIIDIGRCGHTVYDHRWICLDDVVSISLSFTNYGWRTGGMGVYPTNSAEACCHIANNSTSQVIIAEDNKQLDKIFAVRDKMVYVLKMVQYSSGEPVAAEYRDQGVISWEEFLNCGIEIGMQTSINKQQGSSDKPWGYFFADKLTFQGVRKKLGLDRCRFQVTGAAPIDHSVVEFFMQLDVPICEMYGMSECTGPHTVSLPCFLTITGRIKEILITKGGENVAPVPVESLMKEELPLLSHCCVIGNDQKYLTMLVTFKCEMDDLTPTDKLSPMGLAVMSQLGSLATSVKEATADPLVTKYITEGMKKVNEKSVSRAAKVQKFRVCPEDFSIPGGELTPTMKVKRKAVTEKYKDLIAEMYEESSLV